LIQKLKKLAFKIIEPIFPYGRDALIFCRIIHHSGRQQYLVGKLASNKTANDFVNHMQSLGFHKYKIAWKDDGEILSLRKLASFDFCYHIRLFEDGEIRGHYERTVESNFWHHFFEVGMEQREREFREFLGELLEVSHEFQKSAAIVAR
jgi:hypothetical protein